MMLYTMDVELSATEFRRNLFQILDRALKGEPIAVRYRNATIRLTPPPRSESKLGRLRRRNVLLVPPDAIVESDKELMAGLEKGWRKEDERL